MINSLKNILSDIGILYKNIIHWNISKILCYLFAFFLGILLSLPFFGLLIIITYFDPINWQDIVATYATTQSFGLSVISAVSNHYIILILEALVLLTAFGFFAFGYAYYIIPLSRIYFSYVDKNEIQILKNDVFFDYSKVTKCIIIASIVLTLLMSFSQAFYALNFYSLNPINLFFFLVLLISGAILSFFTFVLSFTFIRINLKKIIKYFYILGWGALILLIPFLIFILLFFVLLFSFGGIENVFQTYQAGGFSMFSVVIGIAFLLCLLLFIYLSYRISFAYLIFLDDKNFTSEKSGIYYIKKSFKITSGLKIFKFLLVMILFTIFMLPVEFLANIFDNFGNIGSFIFTIISFILLSGLFEFVFLSTYRNIMIKGEENNSNNNENIVVTQ